jgi:hypothetical protein
VHLSKQLELGSLGLRQFVIPGYSRGNRLRRVVGLLAALARRRTWSWLGVDRIRRRGGNFGISALILLWYYCFSCLRALGRRSNGLLLGGGSGVRTKARSRGARGGFDRGRGLRSKGACRPGEREIRKHRGERQHTLGAPGSELFTGTSEERRTEGWRPIGAKVRAMGSSAHFDDSLDTPFGDPRTVCISL